MPANYESKFMRMEWLYYYPASAPVPAKYVENVQIRLYKQTGVFGRKPKPLPLTTDYEMLSMSATPARYDKYVVNSPADGGTQVKYVGLPTLTMAARVAASHDTSMRNAAIAALNSAIRKGQWNSGVFLGELRETSRLFVDTVLSLARFLGSIRKFRRIRTYTRERGRTRRKTQTVYKASWRGVEKTASSLGGLWLLYRYGILPAIADLRDSFQLLRKHLNAFDGRTSVKSPPRTARSTVLRRLNPGTVITEMSTRTWFKAWFTPPSSYSQLLAHFADQLGLQSKAQIAWELTTLSFVVDWFVDIGGYLEALNQPAGFTILTVEENHFTRISQTIDPNGTYTTASKSTVSSSGGRSTEDVVKWSRYTVPYPVPRRPGFSPDLNPKRITDALALLVGNYRRALRL